MLRYLYLILELNCPKDNEVVDAVAHVMKAIYQHIDCARFYKNEAAAGRGIKPRVLREELYCFYGLEPPRRPKEAAIKSQATVIFNSRHCFPPT